MDYSVLTDRRDERDIGALFDFSERNKREREREREGGYDNAIMRLKSAQVKYKTLSILNLFICTPYSFK